MYLLLFFITIAGIISYIDIKKGLILDKVMFPSFMILLLIKYLDNSLSIQDLISVIVVLVIFFIPIVLNMAFGGGDLRFGAFCALFLGLAPIGYFIIFAGLIHIALLAVIKKTSFPFAPAMSIAALGAYMVGSL